MKRDGAATSPSAFRHVTSRVAADFGLLIGSLFALAAAHDIIGGDGEGRA
jgi:hypothetical protein